MFQRLSQRHHLTRPLTQGIIHRQYSISLPHEIIEQHKCRGGTQYVYEHTSDTTNCNMRYAVYLPSEDESKTYPTLIFLSGLTCTEQNFITKSGAQQYANKYGIAIVCPDTSPRGEEAANDDDWDLGQGAGFYVDATASPWNTHFNMYSYITKDIMEIVGLHPCLDENRVSLSGHSMGGHGALMIGMKNPEWFKSVSAFSPIANPLKSKWGQKAFEAYFGSVDAGKEFDSTELIREYSQSKQGDLHLRVDVGTKDEWAHLLNIEDFKSAIAENDDVQVDLFEQDGYDHGFYFISSFIEQHIAHHAQYLE